MYAYVLAFDLRQVDPELLRKQIDGLDREGQIINWWTPFPGTMVLVSESPAKAVAALLRQHTSLAGEHFLLSDLGTDRDGWLPKFGWDFIGKPGPPNDE